MMKFPNGLPARLAAIFLGVCTALSSSAQNATAEGHRKADVTINSEVWYSHTWVWVIGATAFILLLIALLRSVSRHAETNETAGVKNEPK